MSEFVVWLQDNPSAATSLATALISASVAIIVVCLTQWALSKRSTKEILTKKLEELYLLVNKAGEDNGNCYETVRRWLLKSEMEPLVDLASHNVYGLEHHKKLAMYIRLYFPSILQTYEQVFDTHTDLNHMLYKWSSFEIPSLDEYEEAFFRYGDALRVLENEIIENKALLVRSNFFPRKYKKSPNQPMHRTEIHGWFSKGALQD